MKNVLNWLDLIGIGSILFISIFFIFIFFVAYFSPTQTVLLSLDIYGEAEIEAVVLPLAVILGVFAYARTARRICSENGKSHRDERAGSARGN